MKKDWSHLERFRNTKPPYDSKEGDYFGYFFIPCGKIELGVMASSGNDSMPWEHVSVKARNYQGERCPTWDEMCRVKDMFFDDEEVVMQLHPKRSEYVNNHPFVLHLWRPTTAPIPTPPSIAVGIR